ncbi:MAG: response regulator transcription factor [Proteobacteria bacterium]|nr:response regulator transcription factor [Pseudomonadota bacterium]
MKLLLLEDDASSAGFIERGLRELGHQVTTVGKGEQAAEKIKASSYDVLILDRMVPGIDGISVLRQARRDNCATPTILLTAMSGIEDRVEGLEAGADDYLVKPFAFVELVARINALSRRPALGEAVIHLRAGDIEMDLLRRTVRRADQAIELQPREFHILEQLLRNADRVVTRTMLLDRVWDFGFDPKTNIVETHISRLRTKLNEGFDHDAIQTVRGSGYMIAADAR